MVGLWARIRCGAGILLVSAALAVPAAAQPQVPGPGEAGPAGPAPASPSAAVVESDGQLDLAAPDGGLAFRSGEVVGVDAAPDGSDVFAAGRTVTIGAEGVGDAFAAGRFVRLTGATGGGLIAAAQEVAVTGTVGEDMVAAGETVTLDSGGTVTGNAVLGGRRIELNGRIEGAVMAGAQRILVNGEILGDAALYAQEIVLGPQARLRGALRYPDTADFRQDPGAVVEGETTPVTWREAMRIPPEFQRYRTWWVPAMTAAIGIVLGTFYTLLFPGLSVAAAASVGRRPIRSVIVGILALILMPAVGALLLATLIGFPAGVALLLLFLVALVGAFATAGFALGLGLLRMLGQRRWPGPITRFIGVVFGMILLGLILAIPYAGGLLVALLCLVGLGAIVAPAWGRLRAA